MAGGLVVRVVPVDEPAGPVDRALSGGVGACGPDTVVGVTEVSEQEKGKRVRWREGKDEDAPELHARGRGRVAAHAVVAGEIGPLERTDGLAVDEPRQGILLPVNLHAYDHQCQNTAIAE